MASQVWLLLHCFTILEILMMMVQSQHYDNTRAWASHLESIRTSTKDSLQETMNRYSTDLPKIELMVLKYAYMAAWSTPSTESSGWPQRMCTKSTQEHIMTCGASQLLAAFIPDASVDYGSDNLGTLANKFNKQLNGFTTPPSKAIDGLCGMYEQYKNCIHGFTDKIDCVSYPHLGVSVIYDYTCTQGKQAFKASADCMTKLTGQDIQDGMSAITNCSEVFTDLSGTVQFVMSQLHDHTEAVKDKNAIKKYLSILCYEWIKMKRCFFPAYARKCGHEAEDYYSGFLDSIQDSLASIYGFLADNISDITHCNYQSPEQKVRDNQYDGLPAYVGKQCIENIYFAHYMRKKYAACDEWAVSAIWLECLWCEAAHALPELMPLIMKHDKETNKAFCNMYVPKFLTCFDGFTHSCPTAKKMNFHSILSSFCDAFNIISDYPTCLWEFIDQNGFVHNCGNTVSDLLEHAFVRINIAVCAAQDCRREGMSYVPMSKISCLKIASYELMEPQNSSLTSSCPPNGTVTIQRALQSLSDFVDEGERFAEVLANGCRHG